VKVGIVYQRAGRGPVPWLDLAMARQWADVHVMVAGDELCPSSHVRLRSAMAHAYCSHAAGHANP
jgi:hypothetical protein